MTGSQEAVYVAMKTLLDPARDEVLIVEPAFPVYAKIAQVEGIHLRRVTMDPSDDCAFDAQRILEALGPRTRLIVLCSPCNPTGRVISKAATAHIAKALLEREGPPVYVLHDEIYREVIYTGDAGEFGKVYPYTIAVNSLSKSNALTGLRIGWLIAPRDVMPAIVKMHGWTSSCASTFGQRVAFDIFAAGDLRATPPGTPNSVRPRWPPLGPRVCARSSRKARFTSASRRARKTRSASSSGSSTSATSSPYPGTFSRHRSGGGCARASSHRRTTFAAGMRRSRSLRRRCGRRSGWGSLRSHTSLLGAVIAGRGDGARRGRPRFPIHGETLLRDFPLSPSGLRGKLESPARSVPAPRDHRCERRLD